MNRTQGNVLAESGVCEQLRIFNVDTETAVRFTYIGYVSLLFPFAIVLNSFSIFLIIKFKHLRQTTFILALQVILVNLLSTLLATPIAIANAQAGEWILGVTFCNVSGAALNLLYQMRNWLMFMLVCDRFCTVFFPLRYPKVRIKVVVPLYIGTVLIALVNMITPIVLDCMTFERLAWGCIIDDGCTNVQNCQTYRLISVAVATVMGSYIPMVMYIIIFIKARRIRNQTAPSEQVESEEMRERKKQERRANTTYFFLFLSLFGVTFIPILGYLLVPPILRAAEISNPNSFTPLPEPFRIGFVLIRWTYDLLPIVDPISLMRNADVRKALKIFRSEVKAIASISITAETALY